MIKPIDMLGMGPKREAEQFDGGWIVSVTPPAWSGYKEASRITLSDAQYTNYLKWQEDGRLIQDVFPELRSWEREILVTGIPPEDFPKGRRK